VVGPRLRRLLVSVHRDLGYFFAGLTAIYAVSGVAVNHVGDWNPSYDIRRSRLAAHPLPEGDQAVAAAVLEQLGVREKPSALVRVAPEVLKVFLEGRSITVDTRRGTVDDEVIAPRPGLFQANFLHLNHGKGLWTWYADLYALGLLVLAVSGAIMLPGRFGIAGRGKWFLLAGLAIPAAYLLWPR